MAKVKIDQKRCKGCQLCVIFCPKKNIRVDTLSNNAGVYPALVCAEENCTGCGMCVVMCPEACIEIDV
jgi:2-oxoglutarate ferredoxin oxidoreductase subunit delta